MQVGRTRIAGFTLIELMITVAILSILATASVAGYRQYLRRANRTDATAALLRLSAAEERFYLQNDRYATTADELDDPPPAGMGLRGSDHGYYDLSVVAAVDGATTGYTATATARTDGPQRDDDDCQTFSIDQSSRRSAADAGGTTSPEITANCWR